MTGSLLTRQQVAKRLNVSTGWFHRSRRRLEAEGFPKSLPGFAQGRWCPRAVEGWIALHSGAPQAQETDAQSLEDAQEDLRQALQNRAQEIAKAGKHDAGAATVS